MDAVFYLKYRCNLGYLLKGNALVYLSFYHVICWNILEKQSQKYMQISLEHDF